MLQNLFIMLVTVFLERPTRSGISGCLTPDDHKAIISSLFSTEVVVLQLMYAILELLKCFTICAPIWDAISFKSV